MEFTLLWAALLGVGSALSVVFWERRAGLIPNGSTGIADLVVGAAITGLVAGRLAAMLLDGVNPLTHPGDLVIVRAGVDTGFAALGALCFAVVSARRHLLPTLDAISPAALSGLAGWHAGCLFRGACLGRASDLPWAVAQEGSAVTRHPVEIYAAIAFLAATLAVFWWLRRMATGSGVAAAAGLAMAGAIRLITEPLRPSLGSGPAGWYLAAVGVGVLGVAAALLRPRWGGQADPDL